MLVVDVISDVVTIGEFRSELAFVTFDVLLNVVDVDELDVELVVEMFNLLKLVF